MKKLLLLSIATALISITAVAQKTIEKPDLKWLLGSWEMNAGEVKIYENWLAGDNNSYIGTGYVVSGKDTVVTETMKIEIVGGFWVFIAQINNNNPVLFTLKKTSTAKELTFENLEHDNPQRVIYKFVDGENLYARTEADIKGKKEVDEYKYTRTND